MQTIGERLEEARKRKGISIREASEATKIRSEYLHKFESNSLDINLPEIYIRGFLRNYANYLKLNGDKLIADYKTLAPGDGRSSKRESREVYGRVDLGSTARQPATEPAPGAEDSDAGAVAPASTKVRSSAFPASTGPGTTPIDPALLIKGGAVVLAVIIIVVIVFAIRAMSGGSGNATSEVKPRTQHALVLTATGPVEVWVHEDTKDGPVIWHAQMEANDSHSVPKRGELYLTATAMENLLFEINGKKASNTNSGKLTVEIP
jgi:transcriptional regulator with XRE-family HTH domain